MKHIFFLVMMLAFFVFCIAFAGCSAENPICSSNFCAIGEVFPRSELDDNQPYSEVDIDDSVIFATLIGGTTPIPVETAPKPPLADTTTFANIIADAASGGTQYSGKTVTIVAPVRFKFEQHNTLNLFTQNDDVFFYVEPSANGNLDFFQKGRTYQLTVYIDTIRPPNAQFDNHAIFSTLDETVNPIKVNPISVSMKQVADNVASGGLRYLGKTIQVRATVKLQVNNLPSISIVTNNPNVRWGIVSLERDANNQPIETTLNPYTQGNAYTFTVLITRIKPPEALKNYYNIIGEFIEAN